MDDVKVIESIGDIATHNIGMVIGEKVVAGTLITVDGDMGVGKTVLAKGIAMGLGVRELVTSPTFGIVNEYYSGKLPLYHFDLYRIISADEFDGFEFDEYLEKDGVVVVEWPNVIKKLLPNNRIEIVIEKDLSRGIDYRLIKIRECQ